MAKFVKNEREKVNCYSFYEKICKLNLFGSSRENIECVVSSQLGCGYTKARSCFDEMCKQKMIKIEKNKVLNNCRIGKGTVYIRKDKDFAFVKLDNGKEVFCGNKRDAIDGDNVEVAFVTRFGKEECVILNVEHTKQFIYGVIKKSKDGVYFEPNDKNLDTLGIVLVGDEVEKSIDKKVKLKLEYFRTDNTEINSIVGVVDEVFGLAGDPIVENMAIAAEFGFYKEFPEEVEEEAKVIPANLREIDRLGTYDLTDLPFCTWDPENCKDMDDAIYVEEVNGKYLVFVALADVSYYVQEGSSLDQEACFRGTSCYLGDGVYPMLPEKLSNGICSLNPGEERRAIVMEIVVDKQGEFSKPYFMNAIVKSKYKLSYEQAQDIYEDKTTEFDDVKESIKSAFEVHYALSKMRENRGSLVLKTTEPTYILDETGKNVVDIVDKTNIPSTKVIESLMILFNEAVGNFVTEKKLKALFRVHEKPNAEKAKIISTICGEWGIFFDGDVSSKGLARLLESVKGKPEERFINLLVLRNNKKARYQPNNIGHFALASERYIHTTAAIRRYPDIIAQRLINSEIKGKKRLYKEDVLGELGISLSLREVNADKASELSRRLMDVIWAEGQIGKSFKAEISQIMKDGIYVMLCDKMVSVYIPYEKLIKGSIRGYKINNSKTKITDSKNNEMYSIGDVINIVITEANRNNKTIAGRLDRKMEKLPYEGGFYDEMYNKMVEEEEEAEEDYVVKGRVFNEKMRRRSKCENTKEL